MARRRKAEVKTPAKQQTKSSAVRKSSRQRAKKQQEELKVNGDVLSTSVNNSEDCKDSDNGQEQANKTNTVPKKSTRYKNISDQEISITDSGNNQSTESDGQDDLDVDLQHEKSESLEERQMISSENTLNDVVWPEDVIEETIICEEMEVETEVNECSVAQDESVVVEQVLLMSDENYEGKDIVEYTVIQNDDGTESVMVSSNDGTNTTVSENYKNTSNYQLIEQGLSVLHMSEIEDVELSEDLDNTVVLENNKNNESCSFSNSDKSSEDVSKTNSRSLRSLSRNGKATRARRSANAMEKNVKKDCDSKKKKIETNKKVSSIEDKILDSSKDKSTEIKKHTSVSMNVIEQYDTQNTTIASQSNVMLTQENENSSSMSDKMEQQEVSNPPTINLLNDKTIINNNLVSGQQCISNSTETKNNVLNHLPVKAKQSFIGNEEYSRDSETDGKIDCEDGKISSSSENSNDTLLSSNNCKVSDISIDNKNTLNQLSEADKKPGFRSRSGSTDTTGSDSGSNSSGVRRSNRIRTIGLMKQRSRGRGLVTKPSIDLGKAIANQECDKMSRTPSLVQEKDSVLNKDNLDNVPETQSDKENNSNKTISQDILTPLASAGGTTGYDSDSNKPVKVKSRWRRSSELEMSNSGSWSTSKPSLGFSTATTTGSSIGVVTHSCNDVNTKLQTLPVSSPQESKATNFFQDSMKALSLQNNGDINVAIDKSTISSNSTIGASTTFIPKSVGAKISLPMVPIVEDREMEERLSQFEHLKENLYLTERYTSKETKRMVCDCFLTEEEIQRGELGCGEDCLNRLLMIECGPRCIVCDRCTNKRFQNCEYANCEVFRTEKKGFGLRATSDLKPGDFIMEYVGEVVDPKDFRRRAKEYSKDKNRHYYFMALKSDQIIDATMKGNISRFINHSCDPNAETQKWTVNGELRIGFFNKKFVAAGEEITFDYHFQRYGKEAQRCFCEATNCRGWIGDNPEDSKAKILDTEDIEDTEEDTEDDTEDKEEKENKEEKPEKQVKRKREEKKITDHMEDEDLEEQIDKLCASGLKNRAHTLTLSRLMVRSREIHHRSRLLKVIRSGEQACRRLFLDYHGLRLMWSYMMDIADSTSEEAQQFRLEILKTLRTLPIPNRTMLIDSKVLSVVEKWSKQLYHSPNGDSPEDDQSKSKSISEEMEVDNSGKTISENINRDCEIKKETEGEIKSEIKNEVVEQTLISEMASNLLVDWSNLKEVFRIPKKERIEQMKEHEREADRGYKEDVEKEARENSSYDRHRSDRYSRNELEKRMDRRRGRDSPDFEHSRSKDKRVLEERPNLVPVPRMSKFERRQLFALKVAKEEEERQRRQQEDSWQQHQAQCLALGLDPYTTATFDPQSGYPLFFNPQLGQWQAYPIQENTELGQPCRGVYMGAAASTLPVSSQPAYPVNQPPAAYGSISLMQMQNGTPPIAPNVYLEKCPEPIPLPLSEAETSSTAGTVLIQEQAPILDLPPKWKWARDKRGRIYYYHVKERLSQWLPPPPDHIGLQPDSSTSSESSDESSSSNDEDDDLDEIDQSIESMDFSPPQSTTILPETKKRRDGLVQERIISPRREEDRIDHKKYKEIKEKLRRQKERAKLKEHLEKARKHRRSSKTKSHTKHNTSKFQPITSDMSPTMERKIKDTFRINMANVMVHFLNPYRKNDCKQGRITNTEDFKHLARKLTHFVLAKELKHCKSVDELECNDNVKHKAKDFVRKYMNKFGAVYQKSTDED